MTVLQLIANDSFITVNKELIKTVGLEEAVIFGELASEWDYWQKNKGLDAEGYFFSTIENVEDKTTLSEHKQRKALNKLKQLNLIDVKVKGMPAKRYIKILTKSVENLLLNNYGTSSGNFTELDTEKLQRNNNINNNNIINNNIYNTDSKESEAKASQEDTKEILVKKESKDIVSKKRNSRKDQIVSYIEELSYSAETKDYLSKWAFSIGLKRGVTLSQFSDMLKALWESCSDEEKVRESVKASYLNNWFGFYPQKSSFSTTTNKYNTSTTSGENSTGFPSNYTMKSSQNIQNQTNNNLATMEGIKPLLNIDNQLPWEVQQTTNILSTEVF